MPDYSYASSKKLLLEMLAAGRISSTEFATLISIVRGQRKSVEEFRIPGRR